jgi:predicted O-methyltransferase YrrM
MDNKLLSDEGMIACDNILWGNDSFYYKATSDGLALYEFVQYVKDDPRVDQVRCVT